MGHKSHLGNRQGKQAPTLWRPCRWGTALASTKHVSISFLPLEIHVSPLGKQIRRLPAKWKHGTGAKSCFHPEGNNIKRASFSGYKKRITHFKRSSWHFHEKTNMDNSIYCLQILNDLDSQAYLGRRLPSSPSPQMLTHPGLFSSLYIPGGAFNILVFIYLG